MNNGSCLGRVSHFVSVVPVSRLRAIGDAAREENRDKLAELWPQNPFMRLALSRDSED
jgi:hypothetical protein